MATGAKLIHSDLLIKELAQRNVILSARRLRQLATEKHLFPEPVREQYNFLDTLFGLIQHYYGLYTSGSGSLKAIEERTALAKCEVAEIAAARAKNEVEDIAEVERARIALVVLIRQKLLALPAKAASYLACCTDQQQMESELEKQIQHILSDLEAPVFTARPDTQPEDGAVDQPGA
jgi:hypothetical protein